MQIGSGTRDMDVKHIVGHVGDHRLREVLRFCQHFLGGFRTWKSETQRIQIRSGNPQRNNRERETWSFFQQFEMCSRSESGFGFILKNIEDGGFRYFYAHENNTLLDRPKLVCTRDDLAKLKDILNKTDVIESCSREKLSLMWKFYWLTKLTIFAASSKMFQWAARMQFYPNHFWKIA